MKNELAKLTSDLIKFESIKDNYQARVDIIKYVEKYFEGLAVVIKKFDYNNVPSIVVTFEETKHPKIFLSGHLDVVEARPEQFEPYIKDGKVYGRGAGDMKSGCAVMMAAMRYFAKKEAKPSLGLILTTDEEVGGKNGAGYLVDELGYGTDIAIVPDGGKELKTIVLDQKGVLHLKVKAHGKTAHGARPFWGENAIDKLINQYQELRKIVPEVTEREWVNTMNLSKISGGVTTNSVPDEAEMTLDIRYTKIEDKDKILSQVEKVCDDFEVLAFGYPTVQDENNEHIKKYKEISEAEIGQNTIFQQVEGSSDARFFSAHGATIIITRIDHANMHTEDEWADIAEMEQFYNILLKYIELV